MHPDKGFEYRPLKVLSGRMSEYGAVTIPQSTGVDIELLSILQFSTETVKMQVLISTAIAENNGNPKTLWNTFKKILHKAGTIILPDHINTTDLANTFGHFFSDKIMKIRVALQTSVPVSTTKSKSNNSALSSLEPVSEDDIFKILNSSNTTHYTKF